MIKREHVAIVMAKTAIEVMIFTPVIFRFANTNESNAKIKDNNPVEIKIKEIKLKILFALVLE